MSSSANEPLSFSLYLTEQCNLDCTYCYFKKDNCTSLNIKDVKKGLISFFKQITNKAPSITLLGGEPFLDKKKILETVNFIREQDAKKKVKTRINLFTNGTLFDKKIVEDLQQKDVTIVLSLDGIKESNDEKRRFRNGKKSCFDVVIKNIKNLSWETRKKIQLNMVVGPHNCEYLITNVNFFNSLGIGSINFNFLSYSSWSKDKLKILIGQLKKFQEYYVSIFEKKDIKKMFTEHHIAHYFKEEADKMFSCTKVKLAPDKNFYFCDAFFSLPSELRKEYSVGDLKKGFSKEKIIKLKVAAHKNLKGIFPEHYNQHFKGNRMFCPFGVYYYSKINKKDIKNLLINFYTTSNIESFYVRKIVSSLEKNTEFIKLYEHSSF